MQKITAEGSYIFIVKIKKKKNQTTSYQVVESKVSVNHMACLLIHLTHYPTTVNQPGRNITLGDGGKQKTHFNI